MSENRVEATNQSLHQLSLRQSEWIGDPKSVHDFVRRALAQGEFLLAYDVAKEAAEEPLADVLWLKQRMALALAQMGSARQAQEILLGLKRGAAESDRETFSLLGRTYKDEWCADNKNVEALGRSFQCYSEAFAIEPPAYYPGINAASVALLRRDNEKAVNLAARVAGICSAALATSNQGELYYLKATIAEALAILGRREEAIEAYQEAALLPSANLRDLSSTRKQARLLSRHLFGQPDVFDKSFVLPDLVVFSGHMIDAPGRMPPRFPSSRQEEVKAAVRTALDKLNAGIVVSSAASGADILFLEAMLERGKSVHIVLPWSAEEFLRTSVQTSGDDDWTARFNSVIGRAASVRVLGQFCMPASAVGFEYCNLAMSGLAKLMARSLNLGLRPLTVWDGYPGAPGGAGSFVSYWRAHGVNVEVVPIRGAERDVIQHSEVTVSPIEESSDEFETWVRASGRQEIKAILFADIVGYSRIAESAIPKFIANFNQRVSELIARSPYAPINVNTWGDGLYFVFNSVEEGGRFALDLRDLVITTDWEALGLPANFNIRAGLHAGPVYGNFDPITRHLTFTGAHVSRAARIEPITQEGHVFVSEEFAALAAADEAKGFSCDLVGTTPLAKGYGLFRVYNLERSEVVHS